ncbi:hypothetical protein [Yinghuangia soli]|uniref:Uncharacterized protein n=1 Tax=Yinghuangia soli TaxID=2908204 RepID=A0AA41Q5I0_9ACTN|nr:hypothetical protein [Yinghuangia soli]MCF2531948.1 hypothetical protein [Yinghuangia soli]
MYSFDDSVSPNTSGPFAAAAAAQTGTPIFDKLMEEWQRMFRAVPGDRYGEGFGAAANGLTGYAPGGYGMSAPMPVPAFRPDPGYPQAYAGPSGYPAPGAPGGTGGYEAMPQGGTGGYAHAGPQAAPQPHTPPPVHYQMDTPPPGNVQSHPQQLGGYDPYARTARHAQPQAHAQSAAVRSELALMPVAGFQAPQQMPL